MLRVVFIFFICFIVVSLFIGLYHLVRGKSGGAVVNALTVRVVAAVVLLAIVLLAAHFGTSG